MKPQLPKKVAQVFKEVMSDLFTAFKHFFFMSHQKCA